MSINGDYDHNNIFAKILRGEMPCVKVYEDDVALSFMDVFPQSEGHTLVVPKSVTARNFLDLPTEKVGPYLERVHKIAKAVKTALSPEGIIITQFNGALAGQTVFHLHFHIIPCFQGQTVGRHGKTGMADTIQLEKFAEQIQSQLVL